MAGTYKTVLNKGKLKRPVAIGIGVLVSIPLLLFGWFAMQGSFTRASDDEPRDVVIASVTSTSARIEWSTGQATQAVVEYGTAEDALVFFAPETQQSLVHGVDLTLLTPATTHYFRIKIGDKVYTNSGTGKPWQFTTRTKDGQVVSPTVEPTVPDSSGSASLTEIPIATLIPSGTPVVTQKLSPTSSSTLFPTSPLVATSIPTATPTTAQLSCNETDCQRIKQRLGIGCTATDYIRCLNKNGVTSYPTTTLTPTPTSVVIMSNACALQYMGSTSCTQFYWDSINAGGKPVSCGSAFNRYTIQCQNLSFINTPTGEIIKYYDEASTSASITNITIPGSGRPSPASGSTVYCRVRAEDAIGGDQHATPWVYANKTCQ